MRRFSQILRFMNVSKQSWTLGGKHLRTSFLTTVKRIQNLTFQLLQARVTHFLQLSTFAFGCPNKENTKSTEHVGSKVCKMSKATTCLRALWETVGTKVWFRCSLPGSEWNGVNCRQNGVNYRQNGVNRNDVLFSHSSELVMSRIYVKDNHCMHNVAGAHWAGCPKRQAPRIVSVSV